MSELRSDPAVKSLLERMPKSMQNSFTEEQLSHLKIAIGARQWGNHVIDYRGVIKIFRYRYYYVLLAGRNRRVLSIKEQKIASVAQAIFFIGVFSLVTVLTFLFLYLIKSALGIDIFKGFSLGVWDWFKS